MYNFNWVTDSHCKWKDYYLGVMWGGKYYWATLASENRIMCVAPFSTHKNAKEQAETWAKMLSE